MSEFRVHSVYSYRGLNNYPNLGVPDYKYNIMGTKTLF